MLEIKTLLVHLAPYIPFLGAGVVKGGGESGIGVVITRLVEAGIIGAIILYANLQVLEQKFSDMKEDIVACEVSEKRLSDQMEENRVQLQVLTWKLQALAQDMEEVMDDVSKLSEVLDKHSDHSGS